LQFHPCVVAQIVKEFQKMTYMIALLLVLFILALVVVWSLIEIYLDMRKPDKFDTEYLDS